MTDDTSSANGTGGDFGRTFCDLVMKGGITSGVVYPSAIARLAEKYQFRNIGGASAGAIAAAGAAAAEYRRQKLLASGAAPTAPAALQGFTDLDTLQMKLGAHPYGDDRSLLLSLFAPSRVSAPVFGVLTAALNRGTAWGRIAAVAWGLLKNFPLAALLGALLAAAIGYAAWQQAVPAGWIFSPEPAVDFHALTADILFAVAVPVALAVVVALPALAALRRFGKAMGEQNFGLVTGIQTDAQRREQPALTEWLHQLFQDLSGKPMNEPLTFGDLARLRYPADPAGHGLNLRLMTTCVSAGRPFTLPFADNYLHFDPAEMRRYLPNEVVDWMVNHPWGPRTASDAAANALAADAVRNGVGRPLVPMPSPDDMPVILGVRMSLSFPVLLSAIRLYRWNLREIRNPLPGGKSDWQPCIEAVYFTDGGVCSNMPVHMFDAPLPLWPTFAINLRNDLPQEDAPDLFRDRRVVDGERGDSSRADSYPIGRTGIAGTLDFLVTIVDTMQNWRDTLQRAAPGTKDRVVTIRHTKKEGGLNLNMEEQAIAALAKSGDAAGQLLAREFAVPGADPQKDRWNGQRWVRFRNLLPLFEQQVKTIANAMRTTNLVPTGLALLKNPPAWVGTRYPLANADLAEAYLNAVMAAQSDLDQTGHAFETGAPHPRGEMRITPRF